MSNKLSAYPVTLAVNTVSTTYATIAAVLDIDGPGVQVDMIDVTSRDSSGWKEFIGGLIDGGEVSFDILYDPDDTTHSATAPGVVGLLTGKTVKGWKLTLSDISAPTVWSFNALVKAFKPKAPLKDALRASVTLKITASISIA